MLLTSHAHKQGIETISLKRDVFTMIKGCSLRYFVIHSILGLLLTNATNSTWDWIASPGETQNEVIEDSVGEKDGQAVLAKVVSEDETNHERSTLGKNNNFCYDLEKFLKKSSGVSYLPVKMFRLDLE